MAFSRLQKDPSICNNCFRKRFDAEEINFIWTSYHGSMWAKPVKKSMQSVLLDYREYSLDEDVVPHPKGTIGMTHHCPCGVFRSSTTLRPLSGSELTEVGQRVIERAREKDYVVDADQFFDKLRELKRDPDEQHKDDSILKRALDAGIQEVNRDAE